MTAFIAPQRDLETNTGLYTFEFCKANSFGLHSFEFGQLAGIDIG